MYKRGKAFPIFDTERWARSWSRCTGSQPQVTVSHPPGGRLPLLSARPAVTSPAAEHHRRLAGTKSYCLVTEAHRCKQLAQGCYAALPRVGFEPATYWSQVQRYTRCTTPPSLYIMYMRVRNFGYNLNWPLWPFDGEIRIFWHPSRRQWAPYWVSWQGSEPWIVIRDHK